MPYDFSFIDEKTGTLQLSGAKMQQTYEKEFDKIMNNKDLSFGDQKTLVANLKKDIESSYKQQYEDVRLRNKEIRAQQEQKRQQAEAETEQVRVTQDTAKAQEELVPELNKIEGMNIPENQKKVLKAARIAGTAGKYNIDPNTIFNPPESITRPTDVEMQPVVQQPVEQPTQELTQTPSAGLLTPSYRQVGQGTGGLGSIVRQLSGQMGELKTGFSRFQTAQEQAQAAREQQLEQAKLRGEELAAEEIGAIEKQQEFMKQEQQKAQQLEQARQDQMKPIIKEFEDFSKALASKKIDPNRFWSNKSVGQKIGIILASMLYGAGAGPSGPSLLENYINRDIEAQKAEIESGKAQLTAQSNLINILRAKFGDDRAAEAAHRSMAYQMADAELQKIRARTKNMDRLNSIDALSADIQQKAADNMGQAMQIKNNMVTQNLMQQADIKAKQSDIAFRNRQQQAQMAALAARGQMSEQELKERTVPGMQFSGEKIPTKEDAKKATTGKITIDKALGKVQALRDHVKEYGTEWTSFAPGFESQASKVGVGLARDLQLELKNVKGLGVLAGPDLMLLESQIGTDPGGFWTSDYQAQLDALEASIRREWASTSRTLGYTDNTIGVQERMGIRTYE